MTFLPVLILAAGLNGAVSSPFPASHARHAEARLNRMVAAAAPILHRRTVSRAIATGTRRLGTDIERELSLTRVKPAGTSSPQARIGTTLLVGKPGSDPEADATSLLPLLASPTERAGAAGAGSSARAAPGAPRPNLSAMLFGGVLTGFLALAGLTATAFTHLTN